ncbi:MAG: MarR family transcriptional regulator [Pseudoflavonifractor sp.]
MESRPLQEEFLRAIHRFGRLNWNLASGSLTKGEYFTLSIIRRHLLAHPEYKGMYVSELAERLHVTSPAVSRMLGTLERQSLIARSVDQDDRRTTYIVLTPQGEARWGECRKRVQDFTDRVVGRMGAAELETLIVGWNHLADVLEDELKSKGD